MTRPRTAWLRPFTNRVVNPISRRVAGHLPWFGIIIVAGRSTGLTRRVPMNVFRQGQAYVFALTYGTEVDWVKNVLAAGGCQLRTRGRTVELRDPEVIHDPSRRLMPWLVRMFLGVMRVTDFVRMRPAS